MPLSPRRRRSAEVAAVVLATLGALAIRLHALDSQPLWSDEGLTLHRAGLGLFDLLRGRIVVDGFATTDPMPPLYFAALAAGRIVLGSGIWAQRFVGAALSVAAVPLAWSAGRRLFGRSAGLAAAAVTTAAPFVVWYSQELRPYTVLVPCVFAMTAIAAGSGQPVPRARRWAAATVVGVLVHPFAAFAALAQAPFVLAGAWRRAPLRSRRAAVGLAALAALGAFWRLLPVLRGPAQVDFGPVDAAAVARQALAAFAVGISPSLDHPLERIAPLALLAVIGAVVGLADRRTHRAAAMAIAGLVLPIGGVVALSAINPLYNGPRHVLPALPAFVLLVAASVRLPGYVVRTMGLDRPIDPHAGTRHVVHVEAPRSSLRRPAGAAAAVGLAVVAAWAAIVAIAQLQRQFTSPDYVKDDLRSLVADLAVRYVPGDRIVLHDALIGYTFDAEADDLGVTLPWLPIPHFPNEDRFAAEARLLALVPAPGGRIWFVDRPTPRGGFEGDSLVQAADKRWELVERRQYARMWLRVGLREYRVRGLQRIRTLAPGTHPLAEWSNGLALIDVAFERPTPAAGERLGLVGTWRTNARLAGEVVFEVRLIQGDDEDYTVLLGSDALLRERDVEDVAPGSAIETALRATIPVDAMPGAYHVQLRLVDVAGTLPAVAAGHRKPGDDWVFVTTGSFLVDPPRLSEGTVHRLLRQRADAAARTSDGQP